MRQVYLAIKYHENMKNRGLIEQLSGSLKQHGIETVCAVRDLEKWGEIHLPPENLMELVFQAIDACDAIFIEFSEKSRHWD